MVVGRSLQLPDLCRLLRLFSHRRRPRPAVRLPPAGQLQSSLYLPVVRRVLDPLAHFAFELAADLSLYPAWRQSVRLAAHQDQSDDRDGTGRPLAWRRYQLPDVGRDARYIAGV